MNYALVQTTATQPSVEALARAFASGRGLTPADARFAADDAYGFLARDLTIEDALFLQQALSGEGVEVEVVPESDLPQLPDQKLFHFVEVTAEALVVFDPLDRPVNVPWPAIRTIAAGFDRKELKLEIIVGDAELRFSTNIERLNFDRMAHYLDAAEPGNIATGFVNLVRDLVGHAPQALPNRVAHYLTQPQLDGDITEAITYPRPGAYLEELTWLLWRARRAEGVV